MDTVEDRRAVDKGFSIQSREIEQNPPERRTEIPPKERLSVATKVLQRGLLADEAAAVQQVYQALIVGYAGDRGCFPTVETLMRSTHKSRRSVQNALRRLMGMGWIEREAGTGSGRKTSRYTLNYPPELDPAREDQWARPSAPQRGNEVRPRGAVECAHNPKENPRRKQTPPEPPRDNADSDRWRDNGGGDGGGVFSILIGAGIREPKARAIADSGCVTVEQVTQLVEDMRTRSDITNPPAWLAWACENAAQVLDASPNKAKRAKSDAIADAYRPGVDVPDDQLRHVEKYRPKLAALRDAGKLDELTAFTFQTIRAKGYGYAELIDAEAWHRGDGIVYRVDPFDETPEADRFVMILARGLRTQREREEQANRKPAKTLTINAI